MTARHHGIPWHLEDTAVYHLAKPAGEAPQGGTAGVARTSMGFSHHSLDCWGRSASCKQRLVLCPINIWYKIQKGLRYPHHLKFLFENKITEFMLRVHNTLFLQPLNDTKQWLGRRLLTFCLDIWKETNC